MSEQKHILIIDDDPDIVEVMKIVLESRNYRVSSAPNGDVGEEIMKADPPDLVILDVMMRTIDEGFHCCYKFKHTKEFKDIPILISTAVAKTTGLDFDPQQDQDWLPADDYVNKPIMPDDLLKRVERLLTSKNSDS